MNPKLKNIINIVGFYIGWGGCVLGAANDMSYLGPTLMLVFLIAHFYLFVSSKQEIYLVLIICFLGTVIDTILFFSGSFVYGVAMPGIYYLNGYLGLDE